MTDKAAEYEPTPAQCRKVRLLLRVYLEFEDAIEEARSDGFPLDHYRWATKWSFRLLRKLWKALLEMRWIGTFDDADRWAKSQRHGRKPRSRP